MLQNRFLKKLARLVGQDNVLCRPRDLLAYSYDATPERYLPEAVVFATSTAQVSALVKAAHREGVPVLARGAGTNLSGGTLAVKGGIILELSRMNRVLEIDTANQRAVVEPGVVNLDLQNELARYGYLYAPDPASQKSCTLGGNIGEDAGGPHCLKYGVTGNHVLGFAVVLADGEIVNVGGTVEDCPGYDLTGLIVGSEGTFAIVTKLILRIMRIPEAFKTMLAVYDTLEDAGQTVSDIIAAGIIPATLELMDRPIIKAVEESVHVGYPTDADAVLLIELDGLADGMERQAEKVISLCQRNHAREVRVAQDAQEREGLWAGRRGAFGAVARVRPAYRQQDGTVPRTRLVEMLRKVRQIARQYDLLIGNVAHAGDGNLHPLCMYDSKNAEERERVEKANKEILAACVELGGTITGEHGVGLEKQGAMALVFRPSDLKLMRQLKRAFDPAGILNPGKILPPESAGEVA